MKAIAEPNRLQILDMISTGEKCACDILDNFDFTHWQNIDKVLY